MKNKKVFISTSSFGQYQDDPLKILEDAHLSYELNPLGRKLEEKEITEFLAKDDFIGLVAGTEVLSEAVFNAAPNIRVISRVGVGLANIDLKEAEKKHIQIFNTPDVLVDSVSELTVGLILASLRRIPSQADDLRRGKWERQVGSLLTGKTVGIVGMGKIGARLASLLEPFGCQIVFSDVCEVSTIKYRQVSFERLLEKSDIISLHASSAKTIMTKDVIAKMKKGSVLVNTARGHLIDEEVLYQALQSKKLSFAALDVFEKEPYIGKLATLENILLTPHIGSYAVEARCEMEKQSVQNLIQGLKQVELL